MPDITASQSNPRHETHTVTQQLLTRLFNDHYAANRRLWRSVMTLSDEQFTQMPGDGSASVQAQIVRMVANENLWINYLWHDEVEFLQVSHIPTRASIRLEWDALEEEIRDFIDELRPADLERQVSPPFLETGEALTVGESLLRLLTDAVERRTRLRLQLYRMDAGDDLQRETGTFPALTHIHHPSLASTEKRAGAFGYDQSS